MILTSVQIRNYKSISDSGAFSIDRVTSLVGKNESGKTAILHALEKLEPVVSERGKFRVLEDFPRTNYLDYTDDNRPKEVVYSTWKLEQPEIERINALTGSEILNYVVCYLKSTPEWSKLKAAILRFTRVLSDAKVLT